MNINLIKFFDKYLGYFICLFLSIFNKKPKLNKVDKILILQFWGVGESILTLPAIKALKTKYKNSEISILTTKRVDEVFKGHEFINKILILDMNPFSIFLFMIKNFRRYNLVVDMEEYLNVSSIISFFVGSYRVGFSHNVRSLVYSLKVKYDDKKHVVQVFLDLVRSLGINYDTKELIELKSSKKDKDYVDTLLKKKNITKDDFLIGICAGAAESGRQRMWPKERFAKVADELINKYGVKIIFIGSKDERKLNEKIISLMNNKAINFSGLINLKQLFYLIGKCKVFISNDTGPMHIAAAQKCKTIGLFGPNLPDRFRPYGSKNTFIYKADKNCSPCINVHKGEIPYCKNPRCIININVKDVLNASEKTLKR